MTNVPEIELKPLRPGVASDRATTLDLLVRIVPPRPAAETSRPPLNLGLVIDRSGSMDGAKIEHARQAAVFAVGQLLPSDRVSVTIFDDEVRTIVPNTPASAPDSIIRLINEVRARNSTALHAGWVEGGMQVGPHIGPGVLSRILILSDGLANVGETNPDAIAQDVHGLSSRGVGTTAMGVGDDYDEDLLESMAKSGDGNFYHIESPGQLPEIFEVELSGLMATIGHKVSLGIKGGDGVRVKDVLNDLEKTGSGRLMLPNLVVGIPVCVLVRLTVPPQTEESDLCRFRLAWNAPQADGRQIARTTLRLPVVTAEQLDALAPESEVEEQVALLLAARARREAIREMDRGRYDLALGLISRSSRAAASMPSSDRVIEERAALSELEEDLRSSRNVQARKKALFHSYNLQRNRPSRGTRKKP